MSSRPLTITVGETRELVLPLSARARRQAGIKTGDRLEVTVAPRTITITAVEPTYKPTKAEVAAIQKGEAALRRGETVSLKEYLEGLDHPNRQARPKAGRKVCR